MESGVTPIPQGVARRKITVATQISKAGPAHLRENRWDRTISVSSATVLDAVVTCCHAAGVCRYILLTPRISNGPRPPRSWHHGFTIAMPLQGGFHAQNRSAIWCSGSRAFGKVVNSAGEHFSYGAPHRRCRSVADGLSPKSIGIFMRSWSIWNDQCGASSRDQQRDRAGNRRRPPLLQRRSSCRRNNKSI